MLESDHIRLEIAPDGLVLGLYDSSTGVNYAREDEPSYLVTLDGQNPGKADFEDGIAAFAFDGTTIRFKCEAYGDFITMELHSTEFLFRQAFSYFLCANGKAAA